MLWLSFLISTVGLGYFMYGKKAVRYRFLIAGLILMIYPYFIPGILLMLIIALIVLTTPFILRF
jgi:hypothetical protein